MTIFSFTSELEQYLREINPAYVKYTEGLWANEVTSTSQLGNASVTSILSCGIQDPIHAEDIIAQSKPTGKCSSDYKRELSCWILQLDGARTINQTFTHS